MDCQEKIHFPKNPFPGAFQMATMAVK